MNVFCIRKREGGGIVAMIVYTMGLWVDRCGRKVQSCVGDIISVLAR